MVEGEEDADATAEHGEADTRGRVMSEPLLKLIDATPFGVESVWRACDLSAGEGVSNGRSLYVPTEHHWVEIHPETGFAVFGDDGSVSIQGERVRVSTVWYESPRARDEVVVDDTLRGRIVAALCGEGAHYLADTVKRCDVEVVDGVVVIRAAAHDRTLVKIGLSNIVAACAGAPGCPEVAEVKIGEDLPVEGKR